MILKHGMLHKGLKLFKVYINDDPGLTLTYFTGRSNWVAHTFEWGKLLKSHLMGKNCYMTKMAAMPIYGRNLQKSSPAELIVL